jgi:broad specificity phosphatase PhoE
MERLRYDMLVVGHQACIRALMAYLIGTPMEEMPYLDVPLHSVIEIAPGAFSSRCTTCPRTRHETEKERRRRKSQGGGGDEIDAHTFQHY